MMTRGTKITGAALIATFIVGLAAGLLWPAAAQAAPLCEWCDSGEMHCFDTCFATYPNNPPALSQCIDDCIDKWSRCFSICV